MRWVIVSVGDVTDEMIENSAQTSRDTLRLSLDESKTILKWNGDTPTCFDGMTTYSHLEILEILDTSEWTEEEGE